MNCLSIRWQARQRFAKGQERLFYTLLVPGLTKLLFGVFGLAIALPKAARYRCIPTPCALPLLKGVCRHRGSFIGRVSP